MFTEIPLLVLVLGLVSCSPKMRALFIEEIIIPNLNIVESSACNEPATTWATLCHEAFKCVRRKYNDYEYFLFPRYYCFEDSNENKCAVKNVTISDIRVNKPQNLMSCYNREKINSGIMLGPCNDYNEISIYPLNYNVNNNVNVLWVFKKIAGTDNFTLFERCETDKKLDKYITPNLLNSNLPISITDEAEIIRTLRPFFEYLANPSYFPNNILRRTNGVQYFKLCHFVLLRPHYNNEILSHVKRWKRQPTFKKVNIREREFLKVLSYTCRGFVNKERGINLYRLVPVAEESSIVVLEKDVERSEDYYKFHELILNLNEQYFPYDDPDEY